jgi:hypothetical protein
VVSQTNGVWGSLKTLPGTAAGDTIRSLSCPLATNCRVGGLYVPVAGARNEAFVASETNGRWARAEPVPGIAALNKRRFPQNGVFAVSCPSAGHCTAAGTYTDPGRSPHGFVTGP